MRFSFTRNTPKSTDIRISWKVSSKRVRFVAPVNFLKWKVWFFGYHWPAKSPLVSESVPLRELVHRPWGTKMEESGKNQMSGADIVPNEPNCKAASRKLLRRSVYPGFPTAVQASPDISVGSVPLNSKLKFFPFRLNVSVPSPLISLSFSIQSAEMNRSVPFAGSNCMASICRRAFLWPNLSPWISPPLACPTFVFGSHENSVTWNTRLSFAIR